MTKEELWKIYCEKNPSFDDPNSKITMTGRGLKKLFDQTWRAGADCGWNGAKTFEAMKNKAAAKKQDNMDLFKSIFNS